jgi:hypothetical protein
VFAFAFATVAEDARRLRAADNAALPLIIVRSFVLLYVVP